MYKDRSGACQHDCGRFIQCGSTFCRFAAVYLRVMYNWFSERKSISFYPYRRFHCPHCLRAGALSWLLAVCAGGVAAVSPARAEVELPAIISDHMVLQADGSARVWGWAEPGESVTVEIAGQSHRAVADANRRWSVTLSPMEPGGSYTLVITGENRVEVQDVLIGQVWLCAGQSNMEMPVEDALEAQQEIAQADYPQIRLFEVEQVASPQPQENVGGKWHVVTPQNVGEFSAVAYFFGRDLYRELKQPVGLIEAAWGGTLIEAWMSLRALRADMDFRPILERLDRHAEMLPDFMSRHEQQVERWEQMVREAEEEGRELPPEPWVPRVFRVKRFASYLYNGMINPLLPYRLAGVLWYQGESNAVRGEQYRKLLSVMIDDWRKRWEQPQLPFIIVQLANYMTQRTSPNSPSAWAELRESQLLVSRRMPDVGLVVTIDIGEERNIHPKDKQTVGYRAALWALANVYGYEDLVYSGPIFRSFRQQGRRLRLSFRHEGSGLVVHGEKLLGFAVAGENHEFHWAFAEIDGDDVLVWADEVKDPVAVRYGWANNPSANLFNQEGLPASPFRSDNWEGITTGKK